MTDYSNMSTAELEALSARQHEDWEKWCDSPMGQLGPPSDPATIQLAKDMDEVDEILEKRRLAEKTSEGSGPGVV